MKMMRLRAARVLFAISALSASAAVAAGQTYVKSEALVIPTNAAAVNGRAAPYPSVLTVAGGPTKIKTITVKLYSVQHAAPQDMNVLLEAPTGQKILLMRGAGSTLAINTTDLEFDQAAGVSLPQNTKINPGTYRPTAYGVATLPAPAPAQPYLTDLSSLSGVDANGDWKLYLWDSFNDVAGGNIGGGWQLRMTSDVGTEFTYQGSISKSDQPIAGDANVRFTLFPGAVSGSGDAALAGPITRTLTGLEGGVFTTSLDFGSAILSNQALWLEIEAESPIGSGFTKVGPRQKLTIAPQAGRAIRATTADSATVVPWSGVTGVPVTVTNPVQAFARNFQQTLARSIDPFAMTQFPGSAQTFTLAAGQAVVNWTLTAYTLAPNSGFTFRFRIGSVLSEPTVFYFNGFGAHTTISGTALLTVPAGAQQCDLVVTRSSGTGTINVDTNDCVSYTITNIRQ